MRRLTGVLGVAVASAIALSAMGKAVPVGAAGARALDGPQELARVKPTHFRGDLRLLPRTRPRVWSARPELQSPVDVPTAPGAATSDRVVQRSAPATSAPAPSASFAGLDFANWGSGWPPDPNGDVGPTYYVQAVNTSIGVFRKSDGVRVAAFTFDTFFSQSPTGTPCDNNNQTDPVVLYDSMADRWIIADIAWSNFTSGAMYECMAVSASGDPVSGGWYFYAWKTNNGGVIPDYPKLGVWPDGIYMSANDFATSDESFQHVQVWAFNRLQMEAGTAAQSVTFSLSKSVGGTTVFGLLPSNTRAATGLPAAGTPNYFASIWGSYNIRVWKFHVDWATTASSTFTGPTNVPISAFNPGPDSVPEQGGNDIDTLSYRLMMQNQYTNLSGGESLWLTHTVGNGGSPNIAQVRWYQLGVTGGTVAGSPTQQSTWAPDLKNRFMPSLAVDQNSDMAIGYSVSDASIYPAIRYAGRLVGDPSGTLGQGETSLIEGTGFQCCNSSLGPNTRWGDYSAMTIDPDGCRFWYTNEYYANQPTSLLEDDWQTRIGSFQFSSCGGTPPPTIGSFLPTSGTIGTSVTITGTNLTGATSVAFNGTLAGFTVDSATQIRATVPSGAVSGAIDVTTPGGTATSAASFTVSIPSPPAIDSFAPTSGAVGDAVTISGSNLAGAGSVKFQGLAADFSVDSDSQITATVPAAAASGRITVTTPVGTATSAASFTVLPGITGFSPLSGPPGASVAITGTSLASAASVSFNGATASFVVNSGTSITARVPAAATTGKISITTGTGTATSAADFTVLPKLKSFSPTSGTVGTSVAILGSGFSGVSDVAFNGVSSTLVTVVSATQVSAVVPSGATSGPISVTTAAGTATSSTSFLVLPRITGISPTSGIPGDHVTVTGDSFTGATAVRFRGAAAEFTVDSDSQITATVPAAAQAAGSR